MLRNRIITALILAPLALFVITMLPLQWLALVFGCMAALGAYEWAGLMGLQRIHQRLGYVAIVMALASAIFVQAHLYQLVLMVGCFVWVLASAAVLLYPRGRSLLSNPWLLAVLGVAVILPAWVGLLVIHAHDHGSLWLIWVFVLVWGADIGAYFSGRAFGQHKLAPMVSPGKSWEGAVGGLLLSTALCGAALFWMRGFWLQPVLFLWLPIIAGLVFVSVLGDLFESVLKRATGVKDSGTLLPGHGGVLDRIDSLLAVLPVFAVFLAA